MEYTDSDGNKHAIHKMYCVKNETVYNIENRFFNFEKGKTYYMIFSKRYTSFESNMYDIIISQSNTINNPLIHLSYDTDNFAAFEQVNDILIPYNESITRKLDIISSI